MAVRLYLQGGTLRDVGLICQIHERSVQRIVVKHGAHIMRSPGVRPTSQQDGPEQPAGPFRFVRSPCWRAYCENPRCVYHQEVSYVR